MDQEKISIAEAKKHFSSLIGQVAYGKKRILITKRGKPMARLVPATEPKTHLADVKGWLDNDDPFFDTINSIIRDREIHLPRVLRDQ